MGHVDITLEYPIEVSGSKLSLVRMRRPTVNDILAGEKMGGSDGEKELRIFANLCELSPADLCKMDLKDYKRLQAVWQGFLE